MTNPDPTLYCSFCGKTHREVALTIAGCASVNAGPSGHSQVAAICNECVVLCVEAFLLPAGLINIAGPRRMIAGDIGVIV